MLYAIDGTGPWDNKNYEQEMSNSFCRQICTKFHGFYSRGPSIDGLLTFEKADIILSAILDEIRCSVSGQSDLYLMGHSRGGAAVIYIAKKLKIQNIKVKAMFLFDAVDKTLYSNGFDLSIIPNNVNSCYHARRDPAVGNFFEIDMKKAYLEWDSCLIKSMSNNISCFTLGQKYENLRRDNIRMKRATRSSFTIGFDTPDFVSINFENCGIKAESGCRYTEKRFFGSHGAIGGAPIIDSSAPRDLIKIDQTAMNQVGAWMFGHMAAEGIISTGSIY